MKVVESKNKELVYFDEFICYKKIAYTFANFETNFKKMFIYNCHFYMFQPIKLIKICILSNLCFPRRNYISTWIWNYNIYFCTALDPFSHRNTSSQHAFKRFVATCGKFRNIFPERNARQLISRSRRRARQKAISLRSVPFLISVNRTSKSSERLLFRISENAFVSGNCFLSSNGTASETRDFGLLEEESETCIRHRVLYTSLVPGRGFPPRRKCLDVALF